MATLLLFNKPYQVLSQFTDNQGRQTLADYISLKNLYPAGRLDYDSEGLLLLTDSGQLQHRISHPNHKLAKRYCVQIEGEVTKDALQQLRVGVELKDGLTRPAEVKQITEPNFWPRNPPIRSRKNIPTSWIQIAITEGRNRQVRRMTAAVGFPTLRLIRTQIGQWTLNELKPGEYEKKNIHLSASKKTAKSRGMPR